jgi:hypothetical protein
MGLVLVLVLALALVQVVMVTRGVSCFLTGALENRAKIDHAVLMKVGSGTAWFAPSIYVPSVLETDQVSIGGPLLPRLRMLP